MYILECTYVLGQYLTKSRYRYNIQKGSFAVNKRKNGGIRYVIVSKLINGEEKLALVGLGYVGMPIAVAFLPIREYM